MVFYILGEWVGDSVDLASDIEKKEKTQDEQVDKGGVRRRRTRPAEAGYDGATRIEKKFQEGRFLQLLSVSPPRTSACLTLPPLAHRNQT